MILWEDMIVSTCKFIFTDIQNCFLINSKNIFVLGYKPTDFPCDATFPCGNCKLPKSKLLFLKGICANDIETLYDNQYYVFGIKNDRPYFRYLLIVFMCQNL